MKETKDPKLIRDSNPREGWDLFEDEDLITEY